MKILLLSQWCQPEPFFKGIPFAKALQDRGHDVEILTGFPNYPGGKIYPGYHIRLFQQEVIDGIPVNRVALYPSHNRSGFNRILNYMSFALSAAVIGPLLIKKPDVIYVYNLITLNWAAWILKKWHHCPIVFDIQDLWPDSVIDSGMMQQSNLLRLLSFWCNGVYRRATHLTTLSPGFKKELVRRGIPKNNISVIYNWFDEAHINKAAIIPPKVKNLKRCGSFIVMFAGTMGVAQGLDTILDVAKKIEKIEKKIQFVFIGSGVEKTRLIKKAKYRNLSNILFVDRQPPEAMPKILALADVMLVHLKNTPLYRITIPSKIQAYMAAGKPVLCAVQGDAAELVNYANAGIIAEPENVESISTAVLQMFKLNESDRKLMGSNARMSYSKVLSMEAGVKRFESLFFSLRRTC